MFRYPLPKTMVLPTTIRMLQSKTEHKVPHKSSFNIISQADAANFMAFFPKIVQDVVDQQLVSSFPVVNSRIRKVLNFNVPYGSHVTSHLLIFSYKFMENYHKRFMPENMSLAYRMAWCLDIMNCMSLMIDDIIDGAELRRGRKSWYKLEGSQAICDSFLVHSCCLKLLKKYFGDKGHYLRILETFAKAQITATVGETLQYELRDVESFTIENFQRIAQYKTTPIRFYAPIKLASLLSNQEINVEDSSGEAILKQLGILYQIQNDFYDCYGEELIGKVGNDIQENICTILIATALEKATFEQKQTLIDCYGHYDTEKVKRVKAIYKELELENEYKHFEDESRRIICTELKKIEDDLMRNLLKHYSSLIFGRYKDEILNC